MPKFRKKPVTIEAERFVLENLERAIALVARRANRSSTEPVPCYVDASGETFDGHGDGRRMALKIPTLEGVMVASDGDWIILGLRGEVYPCKPDVFEASYELVEETS